MRTGHAFVLTSLVTAMSAGTASAATTLFTADINSAQEVPANASPATGTLSGVYDDIANTFTFSWSISDNLIGQPSSPGAHIHRAPAGTNGPVVFGFNNPDGTWALSGSATWTGLNATEIDALFNEGLYVNFHTTQFAGGEVRGQIMVVPAPAPVALLAGAGLLARRRRR